MKALREHNFKIYFIIIFASLSVVLLGVKNYEDAKAQITTLADKNKIAASENMVGNFSFWLDERLRSLVRAAKFIENAGISQDSEKLGGFIRLFKENSAEFDALQFLREDAHQANLCRWQTARSSALAYASSYSPRCLFAKF